jgi:hypothetical protein
MASKCATPGVVYTTSIKTRELVLSVEMPMDMNLTRIRAAALDNELHRAIEAVLARFFEFKDEDS